MNEELKPCPFCGSTRLSIKSRRRKAGLGMEIAATYSVRCNVCKARGGVAGIDTSRREYLEKKVNAEKIAVDMWNRRTCNEVN